jgi:hypothetical protein
LIYVNEYLKQQKQEKNEPNAEVVKKSYSFQAKPG